MNAKEMTSPVVTLGAEGQSLESPVPGNWPAGFGGGGGGDDPNGHRALPLSYLTRGMEKVTQGEGVTLDRRRQRKELMLCSTQASFFADGLNRR